MDDSNYQAFPQHPQSRLSEEELELETKHFQRILKAFASYEHNCGPILKKYRDDFNRLPPQHQKLLTAYSEKIDKVKSCLHVNQLFYDRVIEPHFNSDSVKDDEIPKEDLMSFISLTQTEGENLRSLFRHIMRDWSSLGTQERDQNYSHLLKCLLNSFPPNSISSIRVLVPGAGLGRLAYEISQAGFVCQGNEFSLFMLLVSEMILTRNLPANSLDIYPFVLPFSNHLKIQDQLKCISIPDVEIRGAPSDFSMVAGDFLEVYSDDAKCWDAIVTCYFIDTAKNIIDYIELIHQLLVDDGIWINFGPLLYHFEGHAKEMSIELSVEEIKKIILKMGFEFEDENFQSSTYAQDPSSMYKTNYNCWYFKARKSNSKSQ